VKLLLYSNNSLLLPSRTQSSFTELLSNSYGATNDSLVTGYIFLILGLPIRQNTGVLCQVHRPEVSQHRPEVVVQRSASPERGPEVAVVVLLHLRRPAGLQRSRD